MRRGPASAGAGAVQPVRLLSARAPRGMSRWPHALAWHQRTPAAKGGGHCQPPGEHTAAQAATGVPAAGQAIRRSASVQGGARGGGARTEAPPGCSGPPAARRPDCAPPAPRHVANSPQRGCRTPGDKVQAFGSAPPAPRHIAPPLPTLAGSRTSVGGCAGVWRRSLGRPLAVMQRKQGMLAR